MRYVLNGFLKNIGIKGVRIKQEPIKLTETAVITPTGIYSLAHKSNFAGHVIVTAGLRRMHFPRPGFFLRWNSNLQQVDFSQGFASNNILGPVVLAVNDSFLHLHV